MIIKDNGFDEIDRAVRRRTFGTLSTMDRRGAPHATAVIYAVSPPDQPLTLFVTTRSTTAKVHHIREHPEAAFVIPVPHRLPVFPPSAVQFQGLATILEANDTAAIDAFQKSWFHRRIHVCVAGRALVVVTVETLPSLGSSMRRLLRRALACSFARESTNLSTTSG